MKRKNKTKFVILFLAFVLVIATALFGIQAITADASTEKILFSIYSRYGDGSSSSSSDIGSGHAWLVIENQTGSRHSFYNTYILAGETFSIGTWGNIEDPNTGSNAKNAWLNLEAYLNYGAYSVSSLTITITVSELTTISKYCKEKNNWNIVANCAYFASYIWNQIAPDDLQINAFGGVAYFPSILKSSIEEKDSYQSNRVFAYNDYTGYCTNDTTFKYIDPSEIDFDD